jgi:hypothetical protein
LDFNGVEVNASINPTGQVHCGSESGDWVLETGNVDLVGRYFSSEIEKTNLCLDLKSLIQGMNYRKVKHTIINNMDRRGDDAANKRTVGTGTWLSFQVFAYPQIWLWKEEVDARWALTSVEPMSLELQRECQAAPDKLLARPTYRPDGAARILASRMPWPSSVYIRGRMLCPYILYGSVTKEIAVESWPWWFLSGNQLGDAAFTGYYIEVWDTKIPGPSGQADIDVRDLCTSDRAQLPRGWEFGDPPPGYEGRTPVLFMVPKLFVCCPIDSGGIGGLPYREPTSAWATIETTRPYVKPMTVYEQLNAEECSHARGYRPIPRLREVWGGSKVYH